MIERKLHITKKKLKKIAIFLATCILIILVWTGFRISKRIRNHIAEKNRDNEEISTNMPVDLTTKVPETFIEDYINPSSEDEAKAYKKYGYDNCLFTTNGLIVAPDEYNGVPERLFTDVWLEDSVLKNVLKPNIGEIDVIEIANNSAYAYITLKNVEKKEIEEYAKNVKTEYSNEKKKEKLKAYIYYGMNDEGEKVEITYYADKTAKIEYYFK